MHIVSTHNEPIDIKLLNRMIERSCATQGFGSQPYRVPGIKGSPLSTAAFTSFTLAPFIAVNLHSQKSLWDGKPKFTKTVLVFGLERRYRRRSCSFWLRSSVQTTALSSSLGTHPATAPRQLLLYRPLKAFIIASRTFLVHLLA